MSRVIWLALLLVVTSSACTAEGSGSTSTPQSTPEESTTSETSLSGMEGSTTIHLDTASESTTTTASASTDNEGVVSDDAEVWLAEISDLRDSAGPGRIAVFVSLGGETNSGAPSSPEQPVCVGAGAFSDIQPGADVNVEDLEGSSVGKSILRGSAFDGHIGCGLWSGVDVPVTMDGYAIQVADHRPVVIDTLTLDQYGWIVNLWSNPISMQANCVELDLDSDSEPMTCILLD
jgi:hypothetical protein